jgi:two-component system, cell cycle sensor histidine kinase and response regulator CckA
MRSDTGRSCKVLVVEDEGLIAHDIANRLEAMGHDVAGPVATAEEALAQAPSADIVLMDIRIDGTRDGIEAALEIRARFHIPVIFLTAHADRSTLDRAKQAGPFGYIVKPLGSASLQTGIEMALAKHGAERLIEEREAWLRSTIASVADAVVVATPEGRVLLLNRAAERLTGWSQAGAENEPVSKVVHVVEADSDEHSFRPLAKDPALLALLRNQPVEFDRRAKLIARDGRELEVEGSAAAVEAGGETLGVVLTFRDASARRWEERQLRQAQRLEAAGRLAASAAVEYTNLVGLIRNRTEQLLRQFAEYLPARPALEEIQQAAGAADQMTQRLAEFGTRQVGRPEALSLNAVLRRMTRLIESTAGDRIRVALRPSPGAGQIKADVEQMEMVLMNLVTHACATILERGREHGSEEGQLLIETARIELPQAGRTVDYVLLSLTYSGTEPDAERLFDPSFPAGSGLALAQAHSAVTDSGGYLFVRSRPGGGSRIEMLMPRLNDQALLTGNGPGSGLEAGKAPTILLVDEREPVRTELHNFFEAAGYNLLEACDAAEAIALGEMHEGSLDLVVGEAELAGAIVRGLRATHPALEALRIVGREEGPEEIRHPFTEHALLEKVAALLGGRGAGVQASPAITSS